MGDAVVSSGGGVKSGRCGAAETAGEEAVAVVAGAGADWGAGG